MEEKFKTIIKIILLVVLALIWFIFIQVEYEIITKPELQDDFPIIKGIYAVLFLGIFLLIISLLSIYLLLSIKTKKIIKQNGRKIISKKE